MTFARYTLQDVVPFGAFGVILHNELVLKLVSCTLTRDATEISHLEITFNRGVQLSILQHPTRWSSKMLLIACSQILGVCNIATVGGTASERVDMYAQGTLQYGRHVRRHTNQHQQV